MKAIFKLCEPRTHEVCNLWLVSRLVFIGIIVWGLVNTVMTPWMWVPMSSLGVIFYEWNVLRRLKARATVVAT